QNEAFVREVNALISLYRNGDNSLTRALLGFDGGNVFLFHAAPFTLALLFGDVENAEVVEKAGEDFLHQWASSLKIDASSLVRLPDLDPEQLTALPAKEPTEEKAEVASEGDTAPITPIFPRKEKEVEEEKEEVLEEEELPGLDEDSPETAAEPEPEIPTEESTPVSSMEDSPEKRWNAYRDKVETLFSKVLGRAQAARLVERELKALGVEDGGYLATSQFRPFGQKLIKKVKDRTLRKQLELELVSIVESFVD
ncbi:MAG: hypothetical protein AAGF67_01915, partial [Verrucomicrobiota bacterium]